MSHAIEWEHTWKCGVHKMVTPLGIFIGLNLNSSWRECGVWLVDQWIPLSTCLCMIGCWLHAENFDIFICDACLVIIVHWRCSHVDYIDWFSYLRLHSDSSCCMIILLSLICIFSFLYILFILVWLILFIVHYLVYLNILFILDILILLIISFPILCVDMSDILVICMTAWCMTDTLLCDECISCLCGTHIYPFTSNSLVSVDLVFLVLVFEKRLVALFTLRPS